jgi:RHS repeat-associated protein
MGPKTIWRKFFPGHLENDFGARYYSWRFGRWLSSDWSAVPVAVPYANLNNPQTLNLYSMVADDPESFADLDGHAGGGSTTSASCGNTAPGAAWACVSDSGGELIGGGIHGDREDASLAADADNAAAANKAYDLAQNTYGRQPDGSYKADPAKVKKAIKAKQPIGNGQCVAACSQLSGVTPHTASWTPGKSISELNDTTDVGLAVASFGEDKKFNQAGGDQNSAIYMGHDKSGNIMVVDQWPPPNAKQYNAPFEHPLANHGEGHDLQSNRMENNAYYYHVIVAP